MPKVLPLSRLIQNEMFCLGGILRNIFTEVETVHSVLLESIGLFWIPVFEKADLHSQSTPNPAYQFFIKYWITCPCFLNRLLQVQVHLRHTKPVAQLVPFYFCLLFRELVRLLNTALNSQVTILCVFRSWKNIDQLLHLLTVRLALYLCFMLGTDDMQHKSMW